MRPVLALLGAGCLMACGDTTDSDVAQTGTTSPDPMTSPTTPCGTVAYYVDADEDGYGDAAAVQVDACEVPTGMVANNLDCDDADAAVNPSADEVCNDIDDDCVGGADDGLVFEDYYPDTDGDGFGDASAKVVTSCAPLDGTVTDGTDCDDTNEAVHPAATETCNGIDDDCSLGADDGLVFVDYFPDIDKDGYGDASAKAVSACAPHEDWVADATDCDDSSSLVSPSGTEICNLVDDDCDGVVDDGLGTPQTNHAVGAAVTASTTFGGYDAANVVDGSRDTSLGGAHSWSSTTSNGTFEIDFGQDVSFGRVDLYTSDSYELADYDIEYWDGKAWVGLVSVEDNTDAHRIHTFVQVTASKMRFAALVGPDHQSAYTRINEIEVYENQARSAVASATATASGYAASETIDGNQSTALGHGWSNDGTVPDAVTVDFEECRSLDHVVVYSTAAPYTLRDYDIEVYDGSVWSLVDEVRDNTSTQVSTSFPATAAEQVRITCRDGSTAQPGYARINEIEAY